MKLSPLSPFQQLSAPLVFISVLSCSTAAFAAHPLITDDAGTMGTGKAQLELTGEYGHDKEGGVTTKTWQGDAALTYGISEAVDLVIDLPYLHVKTSDDTTSLVENGFSDTSLAVKWRFYEDNGLSLALKPGLTLPTGDDEKGLGAGKATYSLFFVTSKEMDPWGFHLNLGYIRNENNLEEEKNLWHASIASTLAVTENLTAVANLGVESNPDKLAGTDPAFVLAGLTYALSETIDLDCGIKYGLNDPETDYTVLAGVTWKF
ncbi:MAG: transporter [Desulfurivibrionaceae bacterium]